MILADEDVNSLTQAGNTIWALWDHLGTPRHLADQNESTYTTTVTNHRAYDSFGNLTAETNSAVDLLFGFTGKPFDDDTSQQNNVNRWYDAVLGQWATEDPIQFRAGDPNIRRYISNAPLAGTDPLGLDGGLTGPHGLFGPPTREQRDRLAEDAERRRQIEEYNRRAAQHAHDIARRTREYHQRLLDYYRAIIREMLRVGQALYRGGPAELRRELPELAPATGAISGTDGRTGDLQAIDPNGFHPPRPFPDNWPDLAEAMEHFLESYERIRQSQVNITDGESHNTPFPGDGMQINRERFESPFPINAIEELLHEALHDINQLGLDLGIDEETGLPTDHHRMRHIVPTRHGGVNALSQYHDFLRFVTGPTYRDLYIEIVRRQGVRPTAPVFGPPPPPPLGYTPPGNGPNIDIKR
jgi:RHS repeat-associated protein